MRFGVDMESKVGRRILGLSYIFAVAIIWIAASFVVQSVVEDGVSPFLVTYICNSLFIIYIPLVEIGRYLEDSYGGLLFWKKKKSSPLQESEQAILLEESDLGAAGNGSIISVLMEERESGSPRMEGVNSGLEAASYELERMTFPVQGTVDEDDNGGLDAKRRWTHARIAKVSLLVCPFWFFAQLAFNVSLKYTTVTSNTILSTASSLFTFLISLLFLGEKFTWVKLASVLLCMIGTIIVSLGDSGSGSIAIASSSLLGDIFSLVSAIMYAVYITLIRIKLPDDDGKSGHASMAQFLGFLGLFNFFIFLPVLFVLIISGLKPFNVLTWKQFGVIVSKGLLDNVLSDYLWAKAVLLTTTTIATAGLTIQVPLAALVDTVIGNAPKLMDYLGAGAVIIGFVGINIPSDALSKLKGANAEPEIANVSSTEQVQLSHTHSAAIS